MSGVPKKVDCVFLFQPKAVGGAWSHKLVEMPLPGRVPFRNIFFFHQQLPLTERKSLYNGSRVGEYLP
jgi:hypothetical protein